MATPGVTSKVAGASSSPPPRTRRRSTLGSSDIAPDRGLVIGAKTGVVAHGRAVVALVRRDTRYGHFRAWHGEEVDSVDKTVDGPARVIRPLHPPL